MNEGVKSYLKETARLTAWAAFYVWAFLVIAHSTWLLCRAVSIAFSNH